MSRFEILHRHVYKDEQDVSRTLYLFNLCIGYTRNIVSFLLRPRSCSRHISNNTNFILSSRVIYLQANLELGFFDRPNLHARFIWSETRIQTFDIEV